MNRSNKYRLLILVVVLFLLNLFLFYGKMINIHTDFGREILFSKMVSQGALLYRDMFNTFICPFSYLFNGMVLKFTSVNLNTFYFLGALNCAVILCSIYLISRKFLNIVVSAVITVFVMYHCCFYAGLMNYLEPYSYAIVYGLSACLVSVFLYLNYLESNEKKFLYFAFFMSGLSVSCKYEFFAYSFLLFIFFFFKKEKLMTIVYSSACFALIPLLCLLILIFQGLSYADVKNYLAILNRFIQQPYLSKVYTLTCKPSIASLIAAGKTFLIAGFMFFMVYFLNKKSLKIVSFVVWFILAFVVMVNFSIMEYFSYSFWGFITYFVAILAIYKTRDIKKDLSVLFLVLTAVCVSLKSFWFLATNFYGRYFLPLLLISLIVLLSKYYFYEELGIDTKSQNVFQKTVCYILIFLSFAAFRLNLVSLVLKNQTLKTSYGTVMMTKKEYEIYKPLVDYVEGNTQKTDRIIVLGQAPFLLFLTNRDSIPLYNHYDEAIAGAVKSDKIVEAYKRQRPEYFVVFEGADKLTNYCSTYGKYVCKWVSENYKVVKKITDLEKNDGVYIFKK